VRDRNLHAILETFTMDAAFALSAETADGAEVPFEVVETEGRRGRVPLYCYRPLTGAFIDERVPLLSCLPSYSSAARALGGHPGVGSYLIQRGQVQMPRDPRGRADAVLLAFMRRVFEERSEFDFDPDRFEQAYQELELALFEGRRLETVIAPILGLAFDPSTPEVALGDGLSLVRGNKLADAPAEAVWGDGEEPHVLMVLTASGEGSDQSTLSAARGRFRRVLTALRLFEAGGFALGPTAWARVDAGAWRAVPLGGSGRPRMITLIPPRQEDELRAFCNLIARRVPRSGEIAWALARFEMGCERIAPFEALTDHLLALRALLEPEGPASGRLAQRLSILCARPEQRAAMAERTARAISLERAVIAGLASGERSAGADALVAEMAEHLRAILRDVLCGHLDGDLVAVADALLVEAVSAAEPAAAGAPPEPEAAGAAPEPAAASARPEPAAAPRPVDVEEPPVEADEPQPTQEVDAPTLWTEVSPDQERDPRYPFPQAAPYSAPAGVGSVMPTRHDM
jgi:hypothetical protein